MYQDQITVGLQWNYGRFMAIYKSYYGMITLHYGVITIAICYITETFFGVYHTFKDVSLCLSWGVNGTLSYDHCDHR